VQASGSAPHAVGVLLLLLTPSLVAQTTVATGSIVGTITNPSDAVATGAEVAITNIATGQVIHVTTNSAGTYNSGALIPGDYVLQVTAKGFTTIRMPITVLLGNTASCSVRLLVGAGDQVLDVSSSALQVNTQRPIVRVS
jgi:hypothetical protein